MTIHCNLPFVIVHLCLNLPKFSLKFTKHVWVPSPPLMLYGTCCSETTGAKWTKINEVQTIAYWSNIAWICSYNNESWQIEFDGCRAFKNNAVGEELMVSQKYSTAVIFNSLLSTELHFYGHVFLQNKMLWITNL